MPTSIELYLLGTLVACVTDLRSRRIPNVVTYGTMALVLAGTARAGAGAMSLAFVWLTVTIIAGSIVFGRGWIGGGDIKLMAAGSAAIGYPNFLFVLMYIAIAGGFLAALAAARKGRFKQTVYSVAVSAATQTAVVPHPTSSRIPYALAICAGSCFYAATESIAPWFRLAH